MLTLHLSREVRLHNTLRILPLFILVIVVLLSIWTGVATPTEAGALGALVSLIMVMLYHRLNAKTFYSILLRTVNITTMVFAVIMGAFCLNLVLSRSGFVSSLAHFVASLPVFPSLVIVMMMVANLFLGCFLDTTGVLLLTLPIYIPIVRQLDFNLVWFAILITINTEIGCLTPPVGINLFLLNAVAPEGTSMDDTIKGVAPYWFLYLLLMIMVAFVPQLALWLPSMMIK